MVGDQVVAAAVWPVPDAAGEPERPDPQVVFEELTRFVRVTRLATQLGPGAVVDGRSSSSSPSGSAPRARRRNPSQRQRARSGSPGRMPGSTIVPLAPPVRLRSNHTEPTLASEVKTIGDALMLRAEEAGGRDAHALPIDPVCRMAVDSSRQAGSLVYEGREYGFCSLESAHRFAADPERSLEVVRFAVAGGRPRGVRRQAHTNKANVHPSAARRSRWTASPPTRAPAARSRVVPGLRPSAGRYERIAARAS